MSLMGAYEDGFINGITLVTTKAPAVELVTTNLQRSASTLILIHAQWTIRLLNQASH